MKIAFVCDWLTGMRGGEKVLEAACEIFPQAEIYTLLCRPEKLSDFLNSKIIHTSWLDKMPGAKIHYRYLLPLMPWAIQSFDLGDYDVVISFSHCVAKGVRLTQRPGRRPPLHICFCHTPMRYIYGQFNAYFADGTRQWMKLGADWIRPFLIRWDQKTSRSVDSFVANSENVRRRIAQAYGRDAAVIYPAVDTNFFHLPSASDKRPDAQPYYLMAGALVPYKRIDLAIEACRLLGARLKVVGLGTEEPRLKRLAEGATVELLGWQSDEALRALYQHCEALLFPVDEDFGIAPVEAMACGKPVIAYRKGGALETVHAGETGLFFDAQTPQSLADAMTKARQMRFNPTAIRAHALKFDRKNFISRFGQFVQDAYRTRAAPTETRSTVRAQFEAFNYAALCVVLTALALLLPISIASINVTLGLMTATLVFLTTSGRSLDWSRVRGPTAGCLGLYCAVSILTSLTGVAPAHSLHNFHKDFHKLWAFIILVLAWRTAPKRFPMIALALGFVFIAAWGLAQSGLSCYQVFIVHGLTQDWLRAHAFVHPVTYGEMLAMGFLGGLAWLGSRASRQSTQPWVVGSLALLGAALILNQTRGAFLGILVGLATLCVAEPAFRRWLKWGLPAAALGTAAFALLLPSHRSPIAALWHPGTAGDARQGLDRLVLWDVAWRIFKDHPWLGVGPANYATVFTRYFQGILDKTRVWSSAHNIILQQLAERGLVGLTALLALGWALLTRAWQRVRQAPNARTLWALAATTAFFVMNLTESAFQNEQITTLFLFIWTLGEAGPTQAETERIDEDLKRTKVFEVLECGSPYGVGQQIAALARFIAHDRFEPWVVYSVRPGFKSGEFERMTGSADRHVHIPDMVREISPGKDLVAFWKLYRLMRREKPGVVHAASSKAGVLARAAAWLAGVPRIYYSPHGYSFLQTDVGPLCRRFYWCIEKSVSWIGNVIACSDSERAAARRLSWGQEVFQVRNLIVMGPPPPRSRARDGLVLVGAVGRLSSARNPEAFIRMAERLVQEHPEARFVWIGGGELESEIRREVDRRGLQKKLEITGYIPRERLFDRFVNLDIFVHYSRWEGSPTAIYEAMALGLPVVASDITGNAELVAPGTTGFLAASEDDLLRHIITLVKSANLRTELGRNAQARVKQAASLEESVRAFERLYTS